MAMANEQAGPTATEQLFKRLWSTEIGTDQTGLVSTASHRTAIVNSLEILAETLDRQLTEKAALAYVAVMIDLSPSQCVRAFSQTLFRSRFFPSPAELRALGSPVEPDSETAVALGMLRLILARMRTFGPQLKPLAGALIRDRDGDGRVLPVAEWTREPEQTPAPLPPRTVKAIQQLGMGSYEAGLELISAHPAARPYSQRGHMEPTVASFQARDTAKLEERWIQAWRAAVAE